jgi:hypothetical protein
MPTTAEEREGSLDIAWWAFVDLKEVSYKQSPGQRRVRSGVEKDLDSTWVFCTLKMVQTSGHFALFWVVKEHNFKRSNLVLDECTAIPQWMKYASEYALLANGPDLRRQMYG